MHRPTAANSNLRLVGHHDEDVQHAWRETDRAALNVIKENRMAAHASGLDPTDPRWVLAVRAQSQLQGASLSPERRERIMRTAEQLGVRPFDANMIIALVQDQARQHKPLATATPLLQLLQQPAQTPHSTGIRWIAALLCAMAIVGLMAWWLIGA